jgi:hypothetical protein
VILRSGQLGSRPGSAITASPTVLDGGEDAPLSRRGRVIFRATLIGIFVLGIALIVITRFGG